MRGPFAGGPVLLYDGLCGFCDRTVQLVLAADRRGRIRFAPLQGDFARRVLDAHPRLADVDSLVLVEAEGTLKHARVHVRSSAVLALARHVGGVWSLLEILRLIPRPLRDWAYDAFARRRYRIFGKLDECKIPSAEMKARFLE
jgi:predicted DCC family thiol-disulfide oxidoreductase YuxK